MKVGFEFRSVTMAEVAYIGNGAACLGGYVAGSEAMADFNVYEDPERNFNVRLALLPTELDIGKKLDEKRIVAEFLKTRQHFVKLEKLCKYPIYAEWISDIDWYLSTAEISVEQR